MHRLIIIVLALSIILGIVFWKYSPSLFNQEEEIKPVTINMVGLLDEQGVMKGVIDDYQKVNPNITINYSKENTRNYRIRVQTQIVNNEGPDIFMIHNSWMPMFLNFNYLNQMPESVMSVNEYSSIFYPVAKDFLTRDKKIYGIPANIDGLALYYNEDILKAAGVPVPTTWNQLVDGAVKTVVSDSGGRIQTAGVALGTTSNVDYWPDIIGLLFSQQPGAFIDAPNNQFGADVLRFYTNFVTDPTKKVWDVTLPSSSQMFQEGKLAFYFGPSIKASEFKAANPKLNFKTTSVPQLPGSKVAWGSFYAYVVSARTPYSKESWDFLKYLSSADVQKRIYQETQASRAYGYPYARVDQSVELVADPIIGSYVTQGPIYKSWYLTSNTQDLGIDEEMIKAYKGAIDNVLQGVTPIDALSGATPVIKATLEKYTKPPVTPQRQ